jgi:AcrR family transcriptional regulator
LRFAAALLRRSSKTPVADKNASRTATTRAGILQAARHIFMTDGYSRFTMRKVAMAANISLGNLNYHFPRKDALLKALLELVIDEYIAEFDRRRLAAGESPQRQLTAVLEFWIDDLLNVTTTSFFPELWALANHDSHVADMTDVLYQRARQPLLALLPQVNPRLSVDDAEQLALLMCASMEGLTIFAGHAKPWVARHRELKTRLIAAFLAMVQV